MLLVEDSRVLLQARCHCTSGVGVCGRMWSGQHILSLLTVYIAMLLCKISYTLRSCVLYLVWLLFGDSIPICLHFLNVFLRLISGSVVVVVFGGGGCTVSY